MKPPFLTRQLRRHRRSAIPHVDSRTRRQSRCRGVYPDNAEPLPITSNLRKTRNPPRVNLESRRLSWRHHPSKKNKFLQTRLPKAPH